jgi:nucleotide-binding universal stress UspA family protein
VTSRPSRLVKTLDAGDRRLTPALVATASQQQTGRDAPVRSGPVVIGYDSTAAALQALAEAAALLRGREALVVTVWKAGLGFELVALPASSIGLPPAPVDVRTALDIERGQFEAAQRAAEQCAEHARRMGLEAQPLVVADDPETPVSETLVRVAKERDAAVLVVGAHAHGPVLGGIARAVVRDAECPVLVSRER